MVSQNNLGMEVLSPITGSRRVKKIRFIPTPFLIGLYKSKYSVDVAPYFDSLQEIELYQCLDTGYQFYFPLNLSGDDSFYQLLSKSPHYYIEWKWEHGATLQFLSSKDKILEIGCGKGGFVRKLHQSGYDVTGIELNSEQAHLLSADGLKVYAEMLEEHRHKGIRYDVIVSFQVLEHIAFAGNFIKDSLDLLAPGGYFIFCVPNNDSFIQDDPSLTLNMPPHHMGLWTEEAARNLINYFPLTLQNIFFEPLQRYHYIYYLKTRSLRWFGDSWYRKLGLAAIIPFGLMALPFIRPKGQSMLVGFKKN